MDEREPIHVIREEEVRPRSNASAWLAAGIVVLVIALGLTVGYIYQQQNSSRQLMSRDSDMSSTISQMQNQIDSLTSKLNQAPPAAAPAPPAASSAPGTPSAAARHRSAAENKRLKQMQASLDDQQKQLKDTQDQLAQARSDFQSGISSTRDDLNGSIARTHEELVALEQRGERSYFEFDLTKAKHFQKEGPIMVSLRKADAKHKRYDLALIVDDSQLTKKSVNLYEPVWINGSDMQQVQLVVNKVDKDHVHGYVSAPKYAQSAGFTTVSDRTGAAMSGANGASQNQGETPSTSTPSSGAAPSSDSSSTTPTTPTPQQPQQ